MKVCLNCNFRFERGDFCPRCSSRKTKELEFKENPAEEGPRKPMVFNREGQRVFGDTKDAWKSFHNKAQNACPGCGGTDFSFDHKRKEKSCVKCGEILPMPRRPV